MIAPDNQDCSAGLSAAATSAQCRHCGEEFQKLSTTYFSRIDCPHCGCPDYQGQASRTQQMIIDVCYLEFLTKQGTRSKRTQPIQDTTPSHNAPNTPSVEITQPLKTPQPQHLPQVLAQPQPDPVDLSPSNGFDARDNLLSPIAQIESPKESIESVNQVIEPCPPLWLEKYNGLYDKADGVNFIAEHSLIEATQTQDSLRNNWGGRQNYIHFERNSSNSSYWFIAADITIEETATYYAVLSKRKFRLTNGVIAPIQSSFICRVQGEERDKPFDPSRVRLSEFQVIYPAIVVQLSNGHWRLEHQGILEFPEASLNARVLT